MKHIKRIFFNLIILVIVTLKWSSAQTDPDYWQYKAKPPLGWNSCDIFGNLDCRTVQLQDSSDNY